MSTTHPTTKERGDARAHSTVLVVALILPTALRAQSSHPSVLGDEAYEAILEFHGYDVGMPLHARELEKVELSDHIREKIVFDGIRDSRVPGYLGYPKTGTGPYPCVLLIDGVTGSKERWWQEDSWPRGREATTQFLAAGFAVLALDAQYHGERISSNDFENPGTMYFKHKYYHRTREMILQTTVDHRRAIDYLATRTTIVDTSRIGVLGHSMGGVITFALNACEPRIKASVACVTPLNIWAQKAMSVVSPYTFARGVGKRPFLMLMGKSDPFYSEADANLALGMIEGNPKELVWFESDHRLPAEYIRKSVTWFETHLN